MLFILLLVQLLFSSLGAFQIDKFDNSEAIINKSNRRIKNVKKFFHKIESVDFESCEIKSNPTALLKAAKDSLKYLELNQKFRKEIIDPSSFRQILPSNSVKKTLKYIIKLIEEDITSGTGFRILDPEFLDDHFKFIKWNADINAAKKSNVYMATQDQIRTTSYVIFGINGEYAKSKKYCCALYSLNDDSVKAKYTKQQILRGAFELRKNKNKVKAIAWVTRNGLEKAIGQGTVIVKMPDKDYKVLHVYKNNGYGYDKTIRDRNNQKRYWFFRELDDAYKIMGRRGVIFAGDIFNIGVGKIIALKYANPITQKPELRLGVLADTGGAFINNLYQLDIFAGVFSSEKKFAEHLKQTPDLAKAYILYKP